MTPESGAVGLLVLELQPPPPPHRARACGFGLAAQQEGFSEVVQVP